MARRFAIFSLVISLVGFLSCTQKNNATESSEIQPVPIKGTNVRGLVSIQSAFVDCTVTSSESAQSYNCQLMTKDPETGENIPVVGLLDNGAVNWTSIEVGAGAEADVAPVACTKAENGLSISCLLAATAVVPTDLIMNVLLSNSKGEREEEFHKKPFVATTKELEAYAKIHTSGETIVRSPEALSVPKEEYRTIEKQMTGVNMCDKFLADYSTDLTKLATKPEFMMSEFAFCRYKDLRDDGKAETDECEFLKTFTATAAFAWINTMTEGPLFEALDECRPPAPTITSVDPAEGFVNETTRISVSGTGFTENSELFIGTLQCTNKDLESSTKLHCDAPSSAIKGSMSVRIRNSAAPMDQAVLANGFTYREHEPPNVGSVMPNSGPLAGGTVITIIGTNFTNTMYVVVGGQACRNTRYVSQTELTCETPAGTASGSVGVRVTDLGSGQTDELYNAFTYTFVTSGTPVQLVSIAFQGSQFGNKVFVSGSGFHTAGGSSNVTSLSINTWTCPLLQVISDTQLECDVGGHVFDRTVSVGITSPSGPVMAQTMTFQ